MSRSSHHFNINFKTSFIMKIIDTVVGTAGIVLVQVADQIPTPDTLAEVLKLALQAVIAIATIFSLLRKKKK